MGEDKERNIQKVALQTRKYKKKGNVQDGKILEDRMLSFGGGECKRQIKEGEKPHATEQECNVADCRQWVVDEESKKLLKFIVDHVDGEKIKSQTTKDAAAEITADWDVAVAVQTRRRLAELGYYSFIGFNMLLMCSLIVGISFAYHVGTHESNYEPIRW